MHSKEKDEACLGFLVKMFTKSVHRGGVSNTSSLIGGNRPMPHGMCYSSLGNGVRNGAISITQRGFISDYYKVKPIGQWGKIAMAMGFVDHFGAMTL